MKVGGTYSSEFLSKKEGPSLVFTNECFDLVLQLNSLTDQEIKSFQSTPDVEFALFAKDEIAYFLVRVPGVLEWTDAPYSVVTFRRELWPSSPWSPESERLTLRLVLISGEDQVIRGVREFKLGESLSKAFLDQIDRQKTDSADPREVVRKIAANQKKQSPETMLKKAVARHPAEA